MATFRSFLCARYRLLSAVLSLSLLGSLLVFQPPLLGSADDTRASEHLTLEKNDHICIIGNTLADRMQHDGWLETYLHARFPKHELVIRNLGFSGDELTMRLRSADFGTPDEWLTQLQGRRDLRLLRLQRVVRRRGRARQVQEGPRRLHQAHARPEVQRQDAAAARALLAHRARGPRRTATCPTASENNERLALYTTAMAEVAQANERAVRRSVHADTRARTRKAQTPLTINGIHLNERRQPRSWPRSSTRPCSPASRSSKRDDAGAREAAPGGRSTRTSTGSTATARPTATRSTAAGPT